MSTETVPFFGKPKYGNRSGWKNFYVEEDKPNIYRPSPPVKSLAAKGEWARFYRNHWGYYIQPKDNADGKPQPRTFECIYKENYRTKMVTQDCPECDLIEVKRDEYEQLKKRAIAGGASEEAADAGLGPLLTWIKQHNNDGKWHIIAKNEKNEWGILHLPHKLKQALDDKISKLQAEGIDPLDPARGVWFNFGRTGKRIQTRYSVEVVMVSEIINGKSYSTIKEAPLTAEDAAAIDRDVPDLATLNDNKRVTYEQIKQLVESGGAQEVVEAIFNSTMPEGESKAESRSEERTETKSTPPAETATATKVETKTPEVPVADPEDDVIIKLQESLNQALAQKAAKAKTTQQPTKTEAKVETPTVASGAVPAMADALRMSTSEFLKLFPDPNKKP